jgi:hypothetical protein
MIFALTIPSNLLLGGEKTGNNDPVFVPTKEGRNITAIGSGEVRD